MNSNEREALSRAWEEVEDLHFEQAAQDLIDLMDVEREQELTIIAMFLERFALHCVLSVGNMVISKDDSAHILNSISDLNDVMSRSMTRGSLHSWRRSLISAKSRISQWSFPANSLIRNLRQIARMAKRSKGRFFVPQFSSRTGAIHFSRASNENLSGHVEPTSM